MTAKIDRQDKHQDGNLKRELIRNARGKNTVIEMKNYFAVLISRLDTTLVDWKSLELDNITIEFFRIEKQRVKDFKKETISNKCVTSTKCNTHTCWECRRMKERDREKIYAIREARGRKKEKGKWNHI